MECFILGCLKILPFPFTTVELIMFYITTIILVDHDGAENILQKFPELSLLPSFKK